MSKAPDIIFYDINPLAERLARGDLVLTPNHRLARRIRQAYGVHLSESGAHSWETPQVMSLEHWLTHCYQQLQLRGEVLPALATPRQLLALWTECIRDNSRSASLLRPRATAQLALDAWQNLRLWQLDWRVEPLASRFRYDLDAALFSEWADDFEKRLSQAGLSTLLQQEQKLGSVSVSDRIVLVEFNELPPWQNAVLRSQASQVDRFQASGEAQTSRALRAANAEEEYRAAAQRAAEVLAQGDRRLAILVPSLEQERPVIERVLEERLGTGAALRVNISAGTALSHCGPVRTALGLLALYTSDPDLPEFSALLHSRYRSQDERDQETALLSSLYRRGKRTLQRGQLISDCQFAAAASGEGGLLLGRALAALRDSRTLSRPAPPSQWCDRFISALESLGWPGPGPFDSLEYQQLEHFQQALHNLGELDAVFPVLGWAGALSQLRSVCEETVFQQRTDDSRVQVLGLLEAAGMSFDEIWLCGMEESVWPALARPNAFIPISVQRSHNMPHASPDRETDYARQLLTQLSRAAVDITISYSPGESDLPAGLSPLVEDVFAPKLDDASTGTFENHWLKDFESSARSLVTDGQAPAVQSKELERQKGGSGLIADQSRCPFRAFAQHRLKLRPLPDLDDALSAAERGELLHEALFHIWGELQDQRSLLELGESQRSELINRCVGEVTTELRKRYRGALGQAVLDLEEQRLCGLLEAWLALESQRSEFSVVAREENLQAQLGPLQINLRIDRIDKLEDGATLLIDYKSGSCEVSYWMGERPRDPQLPLYASVLPGAVSALSFASIRGEKQEFKGLGQAAYALGIRDRLTQAARAWQREELTWEELTALWQQSLERLAQQYLEGHAVVDPADSASCNWCGLESLCRI